MEHLSIEDPSHQGQPVLGGGVPPPQQQQQQQQQLPPQMFTTAAQLLDLTDKKLMVALRDGRKLIGVLRSWDQFGMPLPPLPPSKSSHSRTLHAMKPRRHPSSARGRTLTDHATQQPRSPDTVERVFAPAPVAAAQRCHATTPSPDQQPRGGLYADIKRGVFLVRGENVLLLGEIDLDKDDDPPPGYELGEPEVVHRLAEGRKDADKGKEKARLRKLARSGV
ncbi:conserved hypothetical protein [Verticillium alfalfae VaMs.102]|uniref:LSM domain-containing protein n=1 Tax=Verticillium alfalfae (strain VaMs.102 / ATCC MYA-4576 / FGSC 10136) TaxID=526221 RepID=C9SQC5_VERA1|nr:conserved hypothetical protein [Verticillium alfalfae VaMs.102]EEY21050.1 conserved hypothetical protein [Verticillium alfalfae VaMs.102]